MVEDAIRKAPSRVVLANRGGERKVYLEGDKYWFGPSVDCIDYLDPLTDQRRRFTSDDCRVTAMLADALPNYTWVMTIGLADDVPADIADRGSQNRFSPAPRSRVGVLLQRRQQRPHIYEMARHRGGEAQFRQAPTIVHYSEADLAAAILRSSCGEDLICAEQGIPLINFPRRRAAAPRRPRWRVRSFRAARSRSAGWCWHNWCVRARPSSTARSPP
jgi:trimethylamine--corrinoid protein Co-methyltransferase